jgi:hypothetical protein
MAGRLTKWKAGTIWSVVRLLMALPDRWIARICGGLRKIAYPFVQDPQHEGLLRLAEFEEIFSEGPPLSEVIRNFILQARIDQAHAVIRGFVARRKGS